MKSPFPGMDPYLEPHWRDVHSSLAIYARNHLNKSLPPGLRARVEESIAVEVDDPTDDDVVNYYPDVQILDVGRRRTSARKSGRGAIAEPIIVARASEAETIRSVHIVTTDGNKL